MESLHGKTALVTGAGKGIGRAIALGLAREGVHAALLARSEAQLQAVAAELAPLNVQTAVVAAGVADRAAVEQAVAAATAALGPLDILSITPASAPSASFWTWPPPPGSG